MNQVAQSFVSKSGNENFAKIRKVLSAIDPILVTTSFSSLFAAILAVIATLQSQFVQALTLGCSMGDIVLRPIRVILLQKAKENIPDDLNRWTEPLLIFMTRAAGIMFALFLRHTILTFNLCSKSAELILAGLQEKGYIPENAPFIGTSILMISVVGFAKQIILGASLPIILWIPAIPFLIFEFAIGIVAVARIF